MPRTQGRRRSGPRPCPAHQHGTSAALFGWDALLAACLAASFHAYPSAAACDAGMSLRGGAACAARRNAEEGGPRSQYSLCCRRRRRCLQTTRASPPRWWWRSSWRRRGATAAAWGARRSRARCGPGRRSTAGSSRSSCAGWAHPATGAANASRWTRGSAVGGAPPRGTVLAGRGGVMCMQGPREFRGDREQQRAMPEAGHSGGARLCLPLRAPTQLFPACASARASRCRSGAGGVCAAARQGAHLPRLVHGQLVARLADGWARQLAGPGRCVNEATWRWPWRAPPSLRVPARMLQPAAAQGGSRQPPERPRTAFP